MSTKLSMFKSQDSQEYYAGGALVRSKTKLMITGLPPTMTSEEMRDFFANFDDSEIVRCECNNGSGFAIFRSEEAAKNAINAGISIGNTPLNMRFAMAMTDNDQASTFISQKSSKFAKNSIKKSNDNDYDVNMFPLPSLEEVNNIGVSAHVDIDGFKPCLGFGGGRAVEKCGISFSNNGNGLSINISDNGDAIFGHQISDRQRRINLHNLRSNVISRNEAFDMIDKFIGPKERYTLILGELDFTFALSIIRTLGHGHNVISTSYDTNRDVQCYKYSLKHKIRNNINDIYTFQTGYNGKESIVFRGFDALKLRESLIKEMGNAIGSVIAFDKILFSMPFSTKSNHFDIRNLVFLKRLFKNINSVVNRQADVKPEIHLIMPIFASRSQFESFRIEEIGKNCNLKWRLKTVRIFDHETLDVAFKGYVQRDNYGRRLNKNNFNRYENSRYGYDGNRYDGIYTKSYQRQNFASRFQYIGYYILETM